MDSTTQSASPLRQRMQGDMRMRKLEPRTQEAYVRAVRKLAVYLGRSPDTATVEDLRNFRPHLVDTSTSPITLNATLTGPKFFFDIMLGRVELMARMQPVKLPRRVLSRLFRRRFLEELQRLHEGAELRFSGEHAGLADARAFKAWLAPLRKIEWVVYAKCPFAGPQAVLAYLSRYTHRVTI